jgi:DNA-binding SARP family transcriptional activator
MYQLRIHLFGAMHIFFGDPVTEIKVTRTAQALLAYLLLHRHRCHGREDLASLFWGDCPQDRARSSLNTTLWRLRSTLEPPDVPRGTYLVTTPFEVSVNCEESCWLDVAVFEEQTQRFLGRPFQNVSAFDLEEFESASSLYTGDLLEGYYYDWVIRAREQLRAMYLDGLERLMGYYKKNESYEKALHCGQLILDQDPLREEIHREVMQLYLESGRRAMAARQYEICRDSLIEELGISPMEETQALYSRIVSVAHDHTEPPLASDSVNLLPTLMELCAVMRELDGTLKKLRRSIQQATRLTQDRNH